MAVILSRFCWKKHRLLQKLGKKNESYESLQALADRVPDNPEVLSALAESQLTLGKTLKLLIQPTRALKLDPDISDMHLADRNLPGQERTIGSGSRSSE